MGVKSLVNYKVFFFSPQPLFHQGRGSLQKSEGVGAHNITSHFKTGFFCHPERSERSQPTEKTGFFALYDNMHGEEVLKWLLGQ